MQDRRYPDMYNYGDNPRASFHDFDPRRKRGKMVRDLQEKHGINDPNVLAAMNAVPRHLFVERALASHAYEDVPLPIGYGQTISQPYTVARMTGLLEVEKGTRVLEVGTGSGYQAAVLATLGCNVFSLERIPELCRATSARLKKMGYITVQVFRSDGTLGFPQAAPYERILVTAGGPRIPEPLIRQLADGGILLIPVGDRPRAQRLVRLRKQDGRIVSEDLEPVTFVDLVGNEGWRQ